MIEHVHGTLAGAMGEWLARNRNVTKAAVLKDQFQRLFFERITPESVRKDVQQLPPLWKWVRDNEGKKAPPHLS